MPGRDPGSSQEQGVADAPFDALVWSRTDGPDDDRPLAYPEAGATWWVEAFHPRDDSLDDVRRRIAAGPPRTADRSRPPTPSHVNKRRVDALPRQQATGGPSASTSDGSAPRLAAMTEPADDQARLRGYVEVWWRAVNDFTGLLELPPEQWATPTDLPGWDVHRPLRPG